MLHVKLLGQFELRADGKPVTIATRAGQSLWAFLILNAGTSYRREKLAGLVWPNTSDENARRNLRQELWRIRKALANAQTIGTEYLLADEISIAFNPRADYWLDVAQLERPIASDDSSSELINRLALYRGELLPGFYDDWAMLERERVQAVFEQTMRQLVEFLIREQRWTTILEWGERWIALGQTPEPAYRALMIAFAMLGDRGKVSTTFERYVSALAQDLAVEPTVETRMLYEQLARGEKISSVDLHSTQVAAALPRVFEEPPAPGEPPFKGLQYFEEGDADLFCGRELLTAKLVARLREHHFLAVIIGASGSGKSSVVRAGIVPALKKNGALADGTRSPNPSQQYQVYVITPTTHPLEALAVSLTRAFETITATATLLDDLGREPRALRLFVERIALDDPRPILLVIDQFEELFTLCRDEFERQAFIDNLLTAMTNDSRGLTIIITLRADFYAHLAQYEELREQVAARQEYIGPMTTEELRRAIQEPARRGGWEFEPGLVDLILREVGDEPGALPLLSHALLETWKRRRGRLLTLEGYAESGGVRGAIAQTAETVYRQLTDEQQAIARNIFVRMTELGEGTEDTRRRATFTELIPRAQEQENVRAVLNTLAQARLVTLGEDTAEVAHEALIREWNLLREWLTQDRDGLHLHRHLTQAAQDWAVLERDPGALYRGARLVQAREWSQTNEERTNDLERAFLRASVEAEQREEREREAQRERELQATQKLAEEQSQRAEEQSRAARQLRRRARFLAGALLLMVVMAGIALFFGDQARISARAAHAERAKAESERRIAIARELSETAINSLNADPERSIILALQAVNTTYTVDKTWTKEAEEALHQAIQSSRVQLTLTGHTDIVRNIVLNSDGTRLASASHDKTAKVWDALTGKELVTFAGHNDEIWNVRFSSNGKRLITASRDGTAKIWDVATSQVLRTFFEPRQQVVTTSSDGTRLAIGREDGVIRVWDTDSGQELAVFPGSTWVLGRTALAFSPDKTQLAVVGRDRVVVLWDIASAKLIRTLPSNAFSLAFSEDGKYLATGNADITETVWDLASGKAVLNLAGHSAFVTCLAFSRDGTRLATAGQDGTAKVWEISTGKVLFTLTGHSRQIQDVIFSPDGKRLITAGSDGNIKVWDLSPEAGKEFLILTGHKDWIRRSSYSSDGTRLATASVDKTAKVWDAATGREIHTLSGHTAAVWDVIFSPDGTRLATASEDKSVKVWNATTGRELFTLSGHGDGIIGDVSRGVVAVVFDPDGKRLATAGADGTARIWDAVTGQELFKLVGHEGGVTNVVFSPNGTRIATSGGDAIAKIWDATTGQELLTLSGHTVRIWGLAFSPDGKRLATSGFGSVAKVWDADSGKALFSLTGHVGTVNTVVFSPDGKSLVTSGADRTAKIWDASNGKETLTLTGHTNSVWDAAFSPDGTRLVTASLDKTVRVYVLRIDDLIAIARSRVTRTLTLEECQRYLHMDKCPN